VVDQHFDANGLSIDMVIFGNPVASLSPLDVASNPVAFGKLRGEEVHLPNEGVLQPAVFDEGLRERLVGAEEPVFRFANLSRWGRASAMGSEVELYGRQLFDAPQQPPLAVPVMPELEQLIDNIALF
jgi:hypothetical protein|tara:strand:- start:2387 stop:2767 length:381 start_codon:yes stop_codon:yes gene_type:complete